MMTAANRETAVLAVQTVKEVSNMGNRPVNRSRRSAGRGRYSSGRSRSSTLRRRRRNRRLKNVLIGLCCILLVVLLVFGVGKLVERFAEWRHYKNGTFGENCHGSGCTGLSPENASCWYSMGNADRDTEPQINLDNALATQKYLEQMGYEVRMTRTSNEQNPSMDKRVSYCFPNNDTTSNPDAAAYVCIHSNAGGGRGTSYIALGTDYEQKFIGSDFVEKSNEMGNIINQKVAAATGLSQNSPINTPYLILFNKCPVPIAYMEIGFYDSSDLSILQSSSDEIGKAIAEGVDEYLKNN